MPVPRGLFNTAPPAPQTRYDRNPTLLYSWFCTIFSLTIILFRVVGRLVRNNRMFREDTIMALSAIPLLIRMGCVHVVILFGTNNVWTYGLTPEDIHRRAIGSRLVLVSRIFYALFLWMCKFTISEFLKRMTSTIWKESYQRILHGIRIFLVVTFFVIVLSTLVECRPFPHYWQVVPDPGSHCRQGYAQLITMGVCDALTDIVLVVFPIPLILKSRMPMKRKASLIVLFSLSIILIIIAVFRVTSIIRHNGRQQYRTVWASSDILASAAISNAVVLGSFLRDRGVKKAKYKFGSASESADTNHPSIRRATLANMQWGSDEDLVSGVGGYRIPEELHNSRPVPRAPTLGTPGPPEPTSSGPFSNNIEDWNFRNLQLNHESEGTDFKAPMLSPSARACSEPMEASAEPSREPSFFDIGGLLGSSEPSRPVNPAPATHEPSMSRRPSLFDIPARITRSKTLPISKDNSIELADRKYPGTGGTGTPTSSRSRSRATGRRRGLTTSHRHHDSEWDEYTPPSGITPPTLRQLGTVRDLQDVGGLLGATYPGPRPTLRQWEAVRDLRDVGGLLVDHDPGPSRSPDRSGGDSAKGAQAQDDQRE